MVSVRKKRSVRILFLHLGNAFGGAERTTYNLLKNIDIKKFNITLLTSRQLFPRFSSVRCDSIICTEDIGVNLYFSDSGALSEDVATVADLMNNTYDMAFGMMHYASSLLACIKTLYKKRIKIIGSPRSPSRVLLHEYTKSNRESSFYKTLFSLFCRVSDRLIVPSDGVKDECITNFGAEKEKTIVINASVDLKDIEQKCKEDVDSSSLNHRSLITTACRFSQDKNLSFLIKAFSLLRREREAKLLLIGDGPERASLEALCKSLNIENEVYFLGFQENPFKYIARSDVFIHTCLFEGFGNSIIEAMACGVPVIAADCPYGPGEIIRNGENGLLVGMDDLDGMAGAISSVLGSERIRKTIMENGSKTAAKYSVEKMVKAYEDVFLKLSKEADGD